ncbi:MAG: hypothetical protein P4L80_06935, partial [Xanthobacteraceae bacterium]|nr:hypothetical protein [Xanthobacteraceae bacterium]
PKSEDHRVAASCHPHVNDSLIESALVVTSTIYRRKPFMIEIGYVYLACALVLLAIIINLAIKFDAPAFITRDLSRGDLYSLVDVASGLRPDGLNRDQADRLMARGMVRAYSGNFRATMKGRLALLLRQKVRQRSKIVA